MSPQLCKDNLYIQIVPKKEVTKLIAATLSKFISTDFIHLSQGNVATYVRCGELCSEKFTTNLPGSFLVKNFENRTIFGGAGEVTGKEVNRKH